MKPLLIPLLFLCIATHAQHVVLLEEFSNVNCGPCYVYQPRFDSLAAHGGSKVAIITYRTNFPGMDGYFNLDSKDNQNRRQFYQVMAVPWVLVDGKPYSTNQLTKTIIDSLYKAASPVTLTATHHLSPHHDSVYVTVKMQTKKILPAGCKLTVTIVGAEQRNVIRQLHTEQVDNKRKYFLWHFTIPLVNNQYFQWQKSGVICFIQNQQTKEVLQTVISKLE